MPNYRHATPDKTLEGTTLTHHVYEALRDEILEGKLQPGERLARHALSARLGVSRMPVTEALMRLEQDGLVENQPMVGARVQPLTLEMLRNDQVLREALECQAARLAAEQAQDADLSRLMKQAEAVDRVMVQGDPRSRLGISLDVELHLGVAQASDYPILAEAMQRVFLRRMMRMNWMKSTLIEEIPKNWHAQLIEVIASRDADAAETAMRAHVRFRRDTDREALAAQQA